MALTFYNIWDKGLGSNVSITSFPAPYSWQIMLSANNQEPEEVVLWMQGIIYQKDLLLSHKFHCKISSYYYDFLQEIHHSKLGLDFITSTQRGQTLLFAYVCIGL